MNPGYGMFTLADSDAGTYKKWAVENCVAVFIPTPTKLGFKPIMSVSVKVKFLSVSGSVNTPLSLIFKLKQNHK